MPLTTPKAIALGIAIGAGGAAVFYGMGESDTASPSTTSAPPKPAPDKHEHLQTQLQKTREQLTLAQQKLANQPKSHSSSARVPPASASSSVEAIDYQANTEAVHKQVNQMVKRANQTGEFNLAEQASNAFEKAPRDERWADEHERDLQNAFATEEPLQGAIVQATECKTRRCRITLFYQNKDEVGDISEQLTRLFSHSDDYDFAPASSVYYEGDGETATIFVADDIQHLNTGVGIQTDN